MSNDPSPSRSSVADSVRLLLPFAVAAGFRCWQLGQLEPFVDEGANILTGLDPRIRDVFHPLEQGRPLLIWLFRPATLLPGDLLWASRLMAAMAGLATMGVISWILMRLAGLRAAIWGAWLWALLPLAVWHERLALQDPFVTLCIALAAALLVAAQGSSRACWAAWLLGGFALGTAFLLKISAAFALPWLAIFYFGLRRKAARPLFDARLGLAAVGALIPVACLGRDLLRLGTGLGDYHVLPEKTAWFAGVFSRFETWTGWYLGYDGWPLVLLLAGATIAIPRLPANRVLASCLAGGWAVSLMISPFFYNMSYARYALPEHLPLVLALGMVLASIEGVRARQVAVFFAWVALLRFAAIDRRIVADPESAPIPAQEIEQYVTGPWSGRGTRAVREFLDRYADEHHTQCLVLTHRGLRPGCYALMLAEWSDPRIAVMPFTIYEQAELAATRPSLRKLAADRPVAFFLLYEGSLYPAHPWLGTEGSGTTLAATIDRGGGETFTLYRVTP